MRPIPERIVAKAAGEMYYETGKLCANGHIGKRFTRNGRCVACAAAATKRYYERNPGLRAARVTAHREKHPEETRLARKRWDARNRDKCLAQQARWRAKHPEKHRASSAKWQRENRTRCREAVRRWIATHPEEHHQMARAIKQVYRARKRAGGGCFTIKDIANLRAWQVGCCAACRREAADMDIDHILAVSRGGSSDPSNLQLLCPTCNRSKGDRDFLEWAAEKGYSPMVR